MTLKESIFGIYGNLKQQNKIQTTRIQTLNYKSKI
ncbi:hypothetical protein SAMN04489797_0356 [Winogradskyella sediminis]|uniref:Uncharacterized protein n=1 Tax=Winogradskyella sediminis TaxID=1382466 RepID=A0A1H1MLM8_9FLAO|nr:hypothetical protein SAMN04489797_0356 [Winogradskyella sediminis]